MEEFPSPEISASDTSESESQSEEDQDNHLEMEPIGRRGQWSVVYSGKFYLYGGYAGQVTDSTTDYLDVFDFSKCEWSVVKTEGNFPTTISGACSALVGDCLYMFGGWYRGWRNADVHELNLADFRWKQLTDDEQMKASPMCKDKAGMVDYGNEMLCVTGGYGYSRQYSRAQRGASYHLDTNSYMEIGWTNEIHLFHIKSRKCKVPEEIITS